MPEPTIALGYGPRSATKARVGLLVGVAIGAVAVALLNSPPKVELAGIAVILLTGAAILSGRPLRFLWLALVVAIPVHVDLEVMAHPEHYTGARSFYLDAVTVMAFVLATVAVVRALARRGRLSWHPSILWPALGIYLVLAAATVPGSVSPLLGSMEVIRMVEGLLLVGVVSHLVRTKSDVVFLVSATLTLMFGETLLGLIQAGSGAFVNLSFFGGTVSTLVDTWGGGMHHRVAGTFPHPALFGSYLVVHLALAGALLFAVRRTATRAALGVVFVLGVIALVLTFSRIEWVGFVAAVAVVFVLVARSGLLSRRMIGWTLGVGAVLILLALPLSGLVVSRLADSQAGNLAERVASYRDALHLFEAHPLRGVGLNNYMEALAHEPEVYRNAIPVHNYLLMILAETGAPGLLAFLGVLFAIGSEGRRSLRVSDPLLKVIAIGLVGGVTAYVVDFFSTFTLRFSVMSTLFWLVVGLLVAIRAMAGTEREAA